MTRLRLVLAAFLLALPLSLAAQSGWPVGNETASEATARSFLGLASASELDRVTEPRFAVRWTEATFETEDGIVLSAWYAESPLRDEAPLFLMLHDVYQSKAMFDTFARQLLNEGYSVLAVDLRGFGGSTTRADGTPVDLEAALADRTTEFFLEMKNDVTAALDWLEATDRLPDGGVYLIGSHMGASVAAQALGPEARRVRGAIFISPLMNYRRMEMRPALQLAQGQPILAIRSQEDRSAYHALRQLAQQMDLFLGRIVPGEGIGAPLLEKPETMDLVLEYMQTYAED